MIAVDTNIFIYAHDQRNPDRRRVALDLIEKVRGGVIVWQVCCEFVAASRKIGHQGFSGAAVWARLDELCRMFRVHVPGPHILPTARTLHLDHQVSFWDAMLHAACVDAGVETLYSEDQPGQALPANLTIINPLRSIFHAGRRCPV